MSKKVMKKRIASVQNQQCALSGTMLSDRTELVDTDRIQEKMHGGVYTDDNTRIVEPRAHMARHGILRERPEWFDNLKSQLDQRNQTMRLFYRINNQRLAYERHVDSMVPEYDEFLKGMQHPAAIKLAELDKIIDTIVSSSAEPFVQTALRVRGMGTITLAGLVVYIDLEKAASPSSLWKYVGLDVPALKRYKKGVKGGGNRNLRVILWRWADAAMKDIKNPYRPIYDATKAKLAASDRIVSSRNTEGIVVDVAWKDAKPSHRHGAALRAMIKHLLADYWRVGRTMAGLPTRGLYAEVVLGHDGIIDPSERGWIIP